MTLLSIIFAMIPPETESKWLFEAKLLGATAVTLVIGLLLYRHGARNKARSAAAIRPV